MSWVHLKARIGAAQSTCDSWIARVTGGSTVNQVIEIGFQIRGWVNRWNRDLLQDPALADEALLDKGINLQSELTSLEGVVTTIVNAIRTRMVNNGYLNPTTKEATEFIINDDGTRQHIMLPSTQTAALSTALQSLRNQLQVFL